MLSLGYHKYLVQGGDWGSMLVRYVALLFPESVVAIREPDKPLQWLITNRGTPLDLNHFSAVSTIVSVPDNLSAIEQEGLDRLALFKCVILRLRSLT